MKTFSEFLNENETIKVNVDFNTTNDKKKFVTNLKNNGMSVTFQKGDYSEIANVSGKSKKQIATTLKSLGYSEEEFF